MLALVIGWSVANSRSPLSRMAASRPLRVLGLLSFGIYCWHPIAQAASSQFALLIGLENQDPRIGGFLLFGLYLATTFFVASLTYGLVERPFLGLKDRLRGRSGATPQFAWRQVALVAAMLFAFIVVLDHAIWGLPTELVKRCVVYVAWAVLGVGLWLAVARRLLYAPSAGRVAEPGTRRRVALPWRRCQGRSRTRSCGS
jgi:hypothetical protein